MRVDLAPLLDAFASSFPPLMFPAGETEMIVELEFKGVSPAARLNETARSLVARHPLWVLLAIAVVVRLAT